MRNCLIKVRLKLTNSAYKWCDLLSLCLLTFKVRSLAMAYFDQRSLAPTLRAALSLKNSVNPAAQPKGKQRYSGGIPHANGVTWPPIPAKMTCKVF